MFVCLCKAVCDKKIKELAKEGASVKKIQKCSGAGTQCGSCIHAIKEMVKQESS